MVFKKIIKLSAILIIFFIPYMYYSSNSNEHVFAALLLIEFATDNHININVDW